MSRSSGTGLAGAGALLVAFSLLLPWYVLKVGGSTGPHKSGGDALSGALVALVLVLALVSGWTFTARVHPWLPVAAAAALAVLVVAKLANPPSAESLFPTPAATGFGSDVVAAFAKQLTSRLGLHYAPSWGLWLAAVGAAAALVGTVARARASA